MPRSKIIVFMVVLAVLLSLGFGVYSNLKGMGRAGYWESEIRRYEESDRRAPPKPGVIVFTGSSSIRLWRTLAQDMAPLAVVNRGFGGAQIDQVSHFASRIILPYRPRAVVLYAGIDDLLFGRSPEEVLHEFQDFVALIHATLPETQIYFVSIKPTRLFASRWTEMKRANGLIEEFVRTQARCSTST